ncbi:alkaline phosphatase family protein [Vibrio sp. E150_011]
MFKKTVLVLSSIAIISGCGSESETISDVNKEKKVLILGVDGVYYDYISDEINDEINKPSLPNFDRFSTTKAFVGGYLNTGSHQVSASGPSWSTILTGVWHDQHHVTSNNGAPVAVNSVFAFAHEKFNDSKAASYTSWNDINTGHISKDLIYVDKRVDSSYRPDGIGADEFIAQTVTNDLMTSSYDKRLVFMHLDDVDGAGHCCGWGVEYEQALIKLDAEIGAVYDAVEWREKNLNEEWLVLLVTDHGHTQAGGHGGDTIEERKAFIGTNRENLMNEFFYSPSDVIDITDDQDQNELMAYPSIATVIPTALSYLNYDFTDSNTFSAPSLVAELGAYKVLSSITDDTSTEEKTIQIQWQESSNTTNVKVYRNDVLLAELPSGTLEFEDTVSIDNIGEGTHQVLYTVVSNVGTPVSSVNNVYLGQEVDLDDVLALSDNFHSFDESLRSATWQAKEAVSERYDADQFNQNKAVVINSDEGYVSIDDDLNGVNELAYAFWMKASNSSGDPAVIANKSWASGGNPGFAVAVEGSTIKLNASDENTRNDTRKLSFTNDEWVYVVVNMNLDDDSTSGIYLYEPESDHFSNFAELDLSNLTTLATEYPVNVGEDGTGTYNSGTELEISVADLITFKQSLSVPQIRALQQQTQRTPL